MTLITKKPLPTPTIRYRQINKDVQSHLLAQGIEPWLADLLAKRIDEPVSRESVFEPSLSHIDDPIGIPDMARAAQRIVQAIEDQEKIVFAVDHDMDGTGSAAVLWSAFVDYFHVAPELLEVITSHRLTEGYGITEPVVERILLSDASLVISADKGSSDEPRIKKLAEAGKDVIVTDHHALPVEGPPISAYAVVHPTRTESEYDPYICGAAVAFLTMAKVRTLLLEQGCRDNIPSLAGLIDYVAVSTVADCVALRPDKSYINRAFVKRGLALINQTQRPCWKVFKTQRESITGTEDIGFQLAPPIAAAGRLDWADAGFRFLTAQDEQQAREYWSTLQTENELRKSIERSLREKAFQLAKDMTQQSIVLYFEDGHSGVHGITASRIVETFGKPAAIFAPKGAGARQTDAPLNNKTGKRLASGSFRGIPGLHVRDALQYVADYYPDLLVGFGGHEGAAGATIAIDDFEQFSQAFEEAVKAQLGEQEPEPFVWVDGDIDGQLLSFDTLDVLRDLEPWGKDFPPATFCSTFEILSQRTIGDGSHLRLELSKDNQRFVSVWFNAIEKDSDALPLVEGEQAKLVYKLKDNWYAGQRSIQLQIIAQAINELD